MISWRMAAGWVAALVAATVLTWQIVGLADSQVGASPAAVAPTLTTSDDTTSTTSMASTSTTDDGGTTTTRPSDTTSTSSSVSPTSTTSSPSSTSSSTSSTASTAWSIRTVTTTGGVVVVRYRAGEVELQAATPAPGYTVEIDDSGPPRVRVEFESDHDDVRIEARWDDGALEIDVDED